MMLRVLCLMLLVSPSVSIIFGGCGVLGGPCRTGPVECGGRAECTSFHGLVPTDPSQVNQGPGALEGHIADLRGNPRFTYISPQIGAQPLPNPFPSPSSQPLPVAPVYQPQPPPQALVALNAPRPVQRAPIRPLSVERAPIRPLPVHAAGVETLAVQQQRPPSTITTEPEQLFEQMFSDAQARITGFRGGRAVAHGSTTISTDDVAATLNYIEKCNNEQLRDIIIENIDDDPTTSKRAIQTEASAKIGGAFDVICSNNDFTYIANTQLFCEARRGNVVCFAFLH